MRSIKTVVAACTLVAPIAVVLAQPAPIHNPVVARMPCALSVAQPRESHTQGRPMRVRYSPGSEYDTPVFARTEAGRGEWMRDVRREIGLGLRGACD